jgi:glutathione S-transferase
MPHYKLTYFDIRGFGEGARLIFAQAGVKYDDVRMDMKSTDYKKSKE